MFFLLTHCFHTLPTNTQRNPLETLDVPIFLFGTIQNIYWLIYSLTIPWLSARRILTISSPPLKKVYYVFQQKQGIYGCRVTYLTTKTKGIIWLVSNTGCKITLTSTDIIIDKEGKILWQGFKNPKDTLWKLCGRNWCSVPTNWICFADNPSWHQRRVCQICSRYVWKLPTLLAAVDKGWLGNFPKVSARMIRQNPPVERATAMGYLDQMRQGQRSTKKKAENIHDVMLHDADAATHHAY